jgi:hypothetical protein
VWERAGVIVDSVLALFTLFYVLLTWSLVCSARRQLSELRKQNATILEQVRAHAEQLAAERAREMVLIAQHLLDAQDRAANADSDRAQGYGPDNSGNAKTCLDRVQAFMLADGPQLATILGPESNEYRGFRWLLEHREEMKRTNSWCDFEEFTAFSPSLYALINDTRTKLHDESRRTLERAKFLSMAEAAATTTS